MSNKKRCFVVSPIGDKDSEIRRRSDDLYDLIIEPALEKYQFEVTRADKLNTVTHITSEIIEEIQNCDLCVIDITGHNPNVMYECGRRHETGKPYILLAQTGESLPFDINTIRTIFYDLESAKSVRETVKIIQSFTERHIDDGFLPSSPGDSLASVSESLKRMERHLEFLVSRNSSPVETVQQQSNSVKEIIKELGPTGALNYAFASRNAELCDAVLPLLKGKTNNENFVSAGLTQACILGSKVAVKYMEEEIGAIDNYSLDQQKEMLSSYISGINRLDMERQALDSLEDYFETIKAGTNNAITEPDDRAFLLNQYQRLLNGAKEVEKAMEIGNIVIALCPNDSSYLYNQSINLEANDDLDGALNLIKQCIANDDDDDHLARAVDLFAKVGDKPSLIEALSRLETVSPLQAEVTRELGHVKSIIKS